MEKPRSSLDGISMVGIDTDIESNLATSLASMRMLGGSNVLVVVPYTTKYGRKAYLVVTQEDSPAPDSPPHE